MIFSLKLIVASTSLLLVIVYLGACGGGSVENDTSHNLPAETQPIPAGVQFNFPDKDYSKFDHQSEQHQRLPCLVCHTSDAGSGKVKFKGHIPCSSCHTQHFEQRNEALCSVCHMDIDSGEMKPFPAVSSFKTSFSHAVHTPQANCTTCHSSVGSGVGYSIPAGTNAHANCFQCHATDSKVANKLQGEGRPIDSCATCHQPGSPNPITASSPNYLGGFSHARHVNARGVSCNSCHTVRKGTGEGQVTGPAMRMHKSAGRSESCATCHNGKRSFGANDFDNCKRCHQGNSFSF
jgi:c(7)-type cytochrome triheme protein